MLYKTQRRGVLVLFPFQKHQILNQVFNWNWDANPSSTGSLVWKDPFLSVKIFADTSPIRCCGLNTELWLVVLAARSKESAIKLSTCRSNIVKYGLHVWCPAFKLASKIVQVSKIFIFLNTIPFYLYRSSVITFKPQKSRNTWIILLLCPRKQSIKVNLEK